MLRGLFVLAMLVAGGCQASAPQALAPREAALLGVAPALVLPGEFLSMSAWPAGAAQREFGRNDDAISRSVPPAASPQWVELQTRDRLWTTNGRPREYSTTTVRATRLTVTR